MKSCLYTLSYLDGNDWQGNDRLQRNIKYIQYYRQLKEQLGHELMVFADNASTVKSCNALLDVGGDDIALMRFDQHLVRGSCFSYPYLWRGLYAIQEMIISGFEKIIMIDSDCYVLTQRAADYIKNTNIGWSTLWCRKYNFPEAAIQILSKDAFPIFRSFISQCKFEDRDTKVPMEVVIPFTHMDMTLNCDRWGEDRLEQKPHMDVYCQSNNDTKFMFNMGGG